MSEESIMKEEKIKEKEGQVSYELPTITLSISDGEDSSTTIGVSAHDYEEVLFLLWMIVVV